MKHLTSLAYSVLLSLFIVQIAAAQKSRTISETVDLSQTGRVMIDTYKGSIDVSTWDRDEVKIEAIIEADDDADLVPLTEIVIRESGNSVYIESDYTKAKKKGRRFSWFGNNSVSLPFVHYTIRMPRTADLNIEDYKSEIFVESLEADLNVETYKGEVNLDEITGDLNLDTYKGDVRVRDLAGALELDTYKGIVTVEFSEFGGHSAIDTYRGEVTLRFPEDTGFDLDADMGRSGDLDTNFKLTNVRVNDNNYRGRIGGGGPDLEIETYRGQIQLATMR